MKAERTAVALIIIGAIAMAGITAEDSDAERHVVLWLYTEDGTLAQTLTVEAGQDLRHSLNGTMGYVAHWADISTGYEYPLDGKTVTRDLQLRASSEEIPAEPTPEPANYDLLYIGIGGAVIVALIIIAGRRFT